MRTRQRGQSVVEFGIIAILFTLLMFAIADFGLLLNDWLSVSSGARQLARDAALGAYTCSTSECPGGASAVLQTEASKLSVPGVSADPAFGGVFCCTATSALRLRVTYWKQCTPGITGCTDVTAADASQFDSRFTSDRFDGSGRVHGGCNSWQPPTSAACPHPAAPSASGPGDSLTVTLTAAGAQVITPLVRPFFSSATCASASAPCYVPLSTTLTMRFEGQV